MKLKRKNKTQTGVTPKKGKVVRFFIDKKKEVKGLGDKSPHPRNYTSGYSIGMSQSEAVKLGIIKEKKK